MTGEKHELKVEGDYYYYYYYYYYYSLINEICTAYKVTPKCILLFLIPHPPQYNQNYNSIKNITKSLTITLVLSYINIIISSCFSWMCVNFLISRLNQIHSPQESVMM